MLGQVNKSLGREKKLPYYGLTILQTAGWHSGKALAYSAKGLGFDSWPEIFMSEIHINCMDILWNCMGPEAHVGIMLSGLYYKASNRPVSFKLFNLASCMQ